MHSAIVVIQMPEATYDRSVPQAWNSFIGDVDSLRSSKPKPLGEQKGVERLAENVWVVNLQENPSAFARLIHYADSFGLAYKILPIDVAPQWLPAGSDPKPN